MSLVHDVVAEQQPSFDGIVACYWHLREKVENALSCDSPDCHHATVDKELVIAAHNEQLAQMCHQIIEIVEKAM